VSKLLENGDKNVKLFSMELLVLIICWSNIVKEANVTDSVKGSLNWLDHAFKHRSEFMANLV